MYDIDWEGRPIGVVNLEKEGMYYRLVCICRPDREGRYRVKVCSGTDEIDLGICVPTEGAYTLCTRIQIKKLSKEMVTFILEKDAGNSSMEPFRVPVSSKKPFPYLDKLTAARFLCQNGQPIIIIDPTQVRQGSGQNQEHPHRLVLP